MRGYVDAMFALAAENASDPQAFVRALDEPFDHELDDAQRKLRDARRSADLNRRGLAALGRSDRLERV